jgi:hypothetical protein
MDETIAFLAKKVATRYKRSLNHFRPCRPGSELLEQNLVTLLSHEFLTKFDYDDRCIAYSEIPFKSKGDPAKWSSRLDAYLANSDTAYLVEAKSSRHKEHLVADIRADLDRIIHPHTKDSFIEMASKDDRQYLFPKDIYGLVIADFWSLAGKTPWFSTVAEFENCFLPEHHLKATIEKVDTYGRYDYFLILAHTAKLPWNIQTEAVMDEN